MDIVKFRRLPLNSMRTPNLSLTRLSNNKFRIFNEKSGREIGVFKEKTLIDRNFFTEFQLRRIKGTANFIAVKNGKN